MLPSERADDWALGTKFVVRSQVQSSSGGASGDVDMPMAESGPDFGSPGNPIVVQVPDLDLLAPAWL